MRHLLLPALFVTACGSTAPVDITWTLSWDGTDDARINPGERAEIDILVESTSSDPIGLDNVTVVATLAGDPLLDDNGGTEPVSCTHEGNDLGAWPADCRLTFGSTWIDADLEKNELSLTVDVTDAGEAVWDEVFPIDMLSLRAEPAILGTTVIWDSNSDGACSPGESCEVQLQMENTGRDSILDGELTVVSTSSELEITSGSTGSMWQISGGEAFVHELNVALDPAAPDGTPVGLEVRFVDELGNVWMDSVQMPIVGADIDLQVSAARVTSGDGTLQAGTSFQMDVTVENVGSADALDVDAIISSSSGYVELGGATAGYWNIGSGDSVTQNYSGTLSDDTPAGASIEFFLTMEDALGNIYSDSFTLVEGSSGVALVLEDVDYTEVSGDGDARIEPGEAWYADLTVGNAGAVLAADVSAYLSTDSGHISFSDSSEDFGDINPGRSAASSSGFRFTVLASHPGGDTPVDVQLRAGSVTVDTGFSIPVE